MSKSNWNNSSASWNREPLEDHELDELLEAADEHGDALDRVLIYTLAHTGMRANALAHLQEDWIDWQDRTIRIPSEMDCPRDCTECNKNKPEGVFTPKTLPAGARTIPLPDRNTVKLLDNYLNLETSIGVSRQTIYRRVTGIAKETSITKKVTPHVLRHTYGTMLAAKDFSAAEIKSVMGHEHLSTSEQYIEYSGRRLKDAFERKW